MDNLLPSTHLKGHNIYRDPETDSGWRYSDNNEEVTKERPCARCGKHSDKNGHDSCMGHLPGVTAACCGHGKEGYICFENGTIVRGIFRITKDVNSNITIG